MAGKQDIRLYSFEWNNHHLTGSVVGDVKLVDSFEFAMIFFVDASDFGSTLDCSVWIESWRGKHVRNNSAVYSMKFGISETLI